ncbi:MAG: signal recognition particle-docking protein FtsY [Pseudomonadota bacterium]|nr:signal recognition particle-docking protein FtsY [Pseudomonadota bacterium]
MFGIFKRKKKQSGETPVEDQQSQDLASREEETRSSEGPAETPDHAESSPDAAPRADEERSTPAAEHGADSDVTSAQQHSESQQQAAGEPAEALVPEPIEPDALREASTSQAEPEAAATPAAQPEREPGAESGVETGGETAAGQKTERDLQAASEASETRTPAADAAPQRPVETEAGHENAPTVEASPEPEPEPSSQRLELAEVIEPSRSSGPALQEKPRAAAADKGAEKKGWFARMRAGLGKTRANLSDGLADLFMGAKQIDDDLIEDIETQLLMADVGIEATSEIIEALTERVSRKELKDPEALYRALQQELASMLGAVSDPLTLTTEDGGPFVILVVGVNGVGKTTTIGKLTQRFQREGKSVMLAAGDTFRAAAVEQLKVWGERNSVPVVAQHTGADSASVIYDAVAAARARGVDVLIADTAGRLHNKSHLMEELKKVHRVMGKLDANAPHEVMLVLDAGTGQNALSQAATFNEAVPVSGITLTKLDGTAKGGVIFALAKQLKTPIRFIGVGESLDDLRPFKAEDFVDALFDRRSSDGDE